MMGAIGGIAAAIFGVIWMLGAASTGAPAFFVLFGLVFVGNAIFGSRFVIQWLYSERQKRVVVPPVFWYLSFWGSVISLIYAFHIDKLPVILSLLFLPFLYARNLALLHRGRIKVG